MTTTAPVAPPAAQVPPASARPPDGGLAARRAVIRWAWRLFRREWRQQFLIFALITLAVGAVVLGAPIATNTPPKATFGFGTAQDMATFVSSVSAGGAKQSSTPSSQMSQEVAAIQHHFGTVDVIENETITVPGSINTYNLRSQNPAGAFGRPMLSLLSGHFPQNAGQVAVTPGVANQFNLAIGDTWRVGGQPRQVVGMVENPQSLLDEFALVAPGQVTAPTTVTVLFDAHGFDVTRLGQDYSSVAQVQDSMNGLNPETVVLTLATVGMLLIGLVSVGGFTVLAQRRLRSIGMIGAIGATDKNIRLVVIANGVVVGVVGTVIGAALGFLAWLIYRPTLEQSAHHRIAASALPWNVIGPAMGIAVLATVLAAARPAFTVTRVPIVSALSGRPAPPREVHRSAIPGILAAIIAFLLFGASGAASGSGGGIGEVVFGFVALIVALILLSPFFLTALAKLGRRAPIAIRLAVRDLSRYRARSQSALSAISLGVMIAVVISVIAAARYANVLDWVGPNLATNQLMLYSPDGPLGNAPPGSPVNVSERELTRTANNIAASVGSRQMIELYTTSAGLNHNGPGRNWNGMVYAGTPALLQAFGISPSQVDPNADILSMRPGLSGVSNMQLDYQGGKGGQGGPIFVPGTGPPPGSNAGNSGTAPACNAGDGCLPNPVIQEMSALPSGTSAPNTVVTEHAIQEFHLQLQQVGWMIITPSGLTSTQIHSAQLAAAAVDMAVETKNSAPSSHEITGYATLFGLIVALSVLAMSVGLIRSETAGDMRTLAATGASSRTRRTLTAATAGALGLLGAVLGTFGAYVAAVGWFRSNAKNGGLSAISSAPINDLLIILIGMPLIAAAMAWLLAGREPPAIAHQPIE